MRWLLLVALLASACLHPPGRDLERQRAATRAAQNASIIAQTKRDRAHRKLEREDRYRDEKRAAMLASRRGSLESKSILAVFDVEDHDAVLDARDRKQLSAYFATAMLERTANRIVPPDRIRAELLDAKTRSYRACYDEACRIELGRRVAADHTLEPGLFVHQDGCQLGATVYDLTTETTIWASSTTSSCDLMSLFMATETLARSLAEREEVLR